MPNSWLRPQVKLEIYVQHSGRGRWRDIIILYLDPSDIEGNGLKMSKRNLRKTRFLKISSTTRNKKVTKIRKANLKLLHFKAPFHFKTQIQIPLDGRL